VVDLNDILGGRSITGLSLSRSGLSGDPITFQATFADGSQGVFIWSLPPLAGDYNGNGIVGPEDTTCGKIASARPRLLAADGNGNSIVDAADYTVWRDHLGASVGFGRWRN